MIDFPIGTPHDVIRAVDLLESSGYVVNQPVNLDARGRLFSGRIGAHPDDIINALRAVARQQRKRIDRRVNTEYYRAYNTMFSTRAARRLRAERNRNRKNMS